MSVDYNKLGEFTFSSHVTYTFQQAVTLDNTLEIDSVNN
jgi:hypothetical protein